MMAVIQFSVNILQLVFRPFTLITKAGVFQARAKLVFFRFKRLTSFLVPVLRGGGDRWDDRWDDNDGRYLDCNRVGIGRRKRCCCGEDESEGCNKGEFHGFILLG